MGRPRPRRDSVALTTALAFSLAAGIVLAVDFTHAARHLDVAAIVLVIIAAVWWLAWLLLHVHETALKAALAQQTAREQHVEQRLRGLRSDADSDH